MVLASLSGLPWAELDHQAWQRVGLLAAELRDRGQLLPPADLEVAVAAPSSGAVLWTADHHLERLAHSSTASNSASAADLTPRARPALGGRTKL
jgi:predicted nucleic acid-binding protein